MAQHNQQTNTATTVSTSPANPASARRRHLPQVLAAKILTMVLQNGVAMATQSARPNTLTALNGLRAELVLHCPFFDPSHRPEELRPLTRRSQISFTDIVVLMARLVRVLMKQGVLTPAETEERIEVRNECLHQPFFDRALVGSARPFVDDDGFQDEGCVI